MKNVQYGLGVKNMSDQILKEVYEIYETLRKSKLKKYKMTEREIFEKYDKLSEDELNTKINKNVYNETDVVTTVIKRCRGGEKRGKRITDRFRKKLMIPQSEISECPEFELKSNQKQETYL